MKNAAETEKWREIFGSILKLVFSFYNLKDAEFSGRYGCDSSSTRNWKNARSFPSRYLFESLKQYIYQKSEECQKKDVYLLDEIEKIFSESGYSSIYSQMKYSASDNTTFVINILQFCIDAGKGLITVSPFKGSEYPCEGRTRAVVFDFDGTLTKSGKTTQTTWESLWVSLGYDIKECQNLHQRYDRKEITHEEWCMLTEKSFKARNLHRETVNELSKKIHLVKDIKKVFQQLNDRDIKIYIVSGSIMIVIKSVLGSLNQYVDKIKANQFMFNEAGYLTQIIGTKYDFEGKSDYILHIANELRISTKDILFVGNSRNDHFAYRSGARTLCINPRLTDMTNSTIWHEYIETCDSLLEIMKFI